MQTVTANYESTSKQNQKYEADLSEAKCKIEELENQIKQIDAENYVNQITELNEKLEQAQHDAERIVELDELKA